MLLSFYLAPIVFDMVLGVIVFNHNETLLEDDDA